ncbi:MAG: Holliday junction branch migration protein RuvA [Pseudomonadota bacterium]
MIGKLKGIIDTISTEHLILDVNGVGYRIFLAHNLLQQFSIGEHASFEIETLVREDHIHLIGFKNSDQHECYRMLCNVQGVGPRMGLAFLSAMEPSQLVHAIANGDLEALKQISGVGPKLAQRVSNELREKITKLSSTFTSTSLQANQKTHHGDDTNLVQDSISALHNLGYERSALYPVVTQLLEQNPEIDLSNLIRLALAKLSNL